MRSKVIQIPIYGTHLILIEAEDPAEVDKKYDLGFSRNRSKVFAHSLWASFDNKKAKDWNGIYLIFNPKNDSHRKFSYGAIAHEAFHASQFLFEIIGQEPGEGREEPQAYLIDWIVEECIKFLEL